MSDLISTSINDPLVFDTYCRPQVWGGRFLGDNLGRTLPTDGPYGEAWDLCSQKLHVSHVTEGPHAGRSLTDLWSHCGKELTGADQREPFPLLLKWLECREKLSLQVHPDDEMARRVLNEPYGKSEAWVVIHAEPTARIYSGLKPGVTRDAFISHLSEGTVEECVHSFTPVPGDCLSIPAGTIHAAGGGLVVAEVQQSSDATFRLFDWNRLGLDGKPRPLQIELALQAINWNQGPVTPVVPVTMSSENDEVRAELLVDGCGFRMERYSFRQACQAAHSGEFTIWMVLEGTAELRQSEGRFRRKICRGETIVIPACVKRMIWFTEMEESLVTLLCIRLK